MADRPGEENLIPLNKRTKEEQRRITTMGGVASGKARRKKADMKKAMELVLGMEHPYKGKMKTGEELVSLSMFAIASNPRNKASAVAAYREILRVLGQDVPQMDDDAMDRLKEILEVNKANARLQIEQETK